MSRFVQARNGLVTAPQRRFLSAEVCLNGHPTTGAVELRQEICANFCAICGEKTIRSCPNCGTGIRGQYSIIDMAIGEYEPANHCHNCGSAFPWKLRKLEAAKEHTAEIEELNENDREELQKAIDDLASGGARTELAASKFKKLMTKAGQRVGDSLYKLVIDVASEAAKKALLGP